MASAHSTRNTFITVLIGLVGLFLLAWIVGVPNWWAPRETPRSRADGLAGNSAHNIGLALFEYHDEHGHFPAGAIMADDKPGLSWRVELLPYLEGKQIYDKMHLDEPWDSPQNQQFLEQTPDIYATNRRQTNAYDVPPVPPGQTCFLAPVSVDAVLRLIDPDSDATQRTMAELDALGGAKEFVAFIEVPAEMAVPWTKPDELSLDDPRLKAFRDCGLILGRADGSVLYLKAGEVTPEKLKSLCRVPAASK